MMKIEVFTDGSCQIPKRPCGFAWVLLADEKFISEGYGRRASGTSTDAELLAALSGMQAAVEIYQSGDEIILRSDSTIALAWANGSYLFKPEHKYAQYNLLKEIVDQTKAQTLWIKAHSGNVYNDRADELAHYARTGIWKTILSQLKT